MSGALPEITKKWARSGQPLTRAHTHDLSLWLELPHRMAASDGCTSHDGSGLQEHVCQLKKAEAPWPFTTKLQKSQGVTSSRQYWSKQSQIHADSKGEGQ